MRNGAGESRCGVEVRWRTASGDRMGLSAEEYGRRYLMELVGAAVLWECFGARLLELGQV